MSRFGLAIALLAVLPAGWARGEPKDGGVWAPFVPITVEGDALETLKHRFTVTDSALPAQIFIKPDSRELPLERRAEGAKVVAGDLARIGRGPRLRAPLRLEATGPDGTAAAKVLQTARIVRRQEGGVEYRSKLKVGPFAVVAACRYECDGAMLVSLDVGGGQAGSILELVVEPLEPVDLAYAGLPAGVKAGDLPREKLVAAIPSSEGTVWDSARRAADGKVRFLYVGSGDAGLVWLCDDPPRAPEGGSAVVMKRNELGQLTWRTALAAGEGQTSLKFAILTLPSRPRDKGFRRRQWLDWRPTGQRTNHDVLNGKPAADLDGLGRTTMAAREAMKQRARELQAAGTDNRTLLGGLTAWALASLGADCELSGAAAAEMVSREKDCVALYPISLLRVLGGRQTHLAMRIRSNVRGLGPVDDPALDRQVLGRALLHDVGAAMEGAAQPVEMLTLLRALREFGYFADDGLTEFIPYWRVDGVARYGEAFDPGSEFNLTTKDPAGGTYVSIYRRPFEKDGRKGVQALFVLMNERDEAVRPRLYVLDAARVFGAGKVRPTGIEIFHDYDFGRVPDDSDWRKEKIANWYWTYGDKGLKDLEDGGFVKDSSSKGQVAEIYGPIHVPPHDFRVVWGYGLPETSPRKRNR